MLAPIVLDSLGYLFESGLHECPAKLFTYSIFEEHFSEYWPPGVPYTTLTMLYVLGRADKNKV